MSSITTLFLLPVIAFPPDVAPPLPQITPLITQWTLASIAIPDDLPEGFSFTVELDGVARTVELHRFTMRSGDFQLLIDDGSGQLVEIEAPPSRTYRGSVVGAPEMVVSASLLDQGLSAMIFTDGMNWMIEPVATLAPGSDDPRYVVYKSTDVAETGRGCGVGMPGYHEPQFFTDDGAAGAGGGEGGDEGGIAGANPAWVAIGIETDYEYYQRNGSSVPNTVADIELVMTNVDAVYNTYINMMYELSVIVVRSAAADPYVQTDIHDRLCEFRTKWNTAPESSITRGVAQMFTGYNYVGETALGVAWLGAACNQTAIVCGSNGNTAYSIVNSKFEFPFTTPLNLRTALSAHELGHLWNAVHCDDQGAANCHIMCSALGACGGVSGANLKFDPSSIAQIEAFHNHPAITCDPSIAAPVALPFLDTFPSGTINATNWIFNKGGAVSSTGVGEPSPTLSLNLDTVGSNPYQDDEIRSNKILAGGLGAQDLRLSYYTQHLNVEAGKTLTVMYFTSAGAWADLNVITSSGVNPTSYTFWEHSLPANGKHNNLRVRFKTDGNDSTDDWFVDDVQVAIYVPPPPECPADLNEDQVVDGNDLSVILGAWGSCTGCVADINDDGLVDGNDLSIVLGAWGTCPD